MVPDEDIRKFNRFYKKTNKNCALFRRQLTGRKESCKLILEFNKMVKPFYRAAVSAASGVAAKIVVHTFLAATGGLRSIRRIKWC